MKIENWIIQIYLFLMLGVFPLYYQNGYYNMGDAKYGFFKYATIALIVVMGFWQLFEKLQTIGKNKICRKKLNLSMQDWAVLTYLSITVISWLISPYRKETWIGSHEWYMGLLSQMLFVGIYFVVSRYMTSNKWTLFVMGSSAAVVFLISYLHRFRIDPLGLYQGLNERYKITFLGTIGQATWYSSYVAVILPIIMGFYIFGYQKEQKNAKLWHGLTGALILLGFGTVVTQNSDSIYIGIGAALLFLFWFCMEQRHHWSYFLEALLLGFIGIMLTGVLQKAFPKSVPKLEKISIAITQGKMVWIAFVLVLLVYVSTRYLILRYEQGKWKAEGLKKYVPKFRIVFYTVVIIFLFSLPSLVWLVTTERLHVGEGLLTRTGYLVFDDKWGNGRGKTWKYAVRVFKEYPFSMKLFGCGPDGMSFYAAQFHAEEMQKMWKNVVLTNAHNEWLTALLNYGIMGIISYISIFITSVIKVCRNWRNNPMILAAGASILSYAGHNFFCYQQCVCTPLIFIVIGATAYYNCSKINTKEVRNANHKKHNK